MNEEKFDTSLFQSSLKTRWAGQNFMYFDECDSTNDSIRLLEKARRPAGTLVLAESQLAGRGRWGRRWESSRGKSLLMTLVLPDAAGAATPARMGVALGLGLAETIPGRSPILDGFGLIAFAALFPITAVMGYAQLVKWKASRSKHHNRQKLR